MLWVTGIVITLNYSYRPAVKSLATRKIYIYRYYVKIMYIISRLILLSLEISLVPSFSIAL